jgi:hypothetical protein
MAGVGAPFWPDAALLPRFAPVLDHLDYLEVAPETLWDARGQPNDYHRIVASLADDGLAVVGHGVAIDAGSADTARRTRWLKAWNRDARRLGFRWGSDHLGTTSIGGEQVALPLPAPAGFVRLAATLSQLAGATGARAAIENSAWYFYPGDVVDEPTGLADALGDTHHLVLDLHNLWTNSINLGFDPIRWLDAAPLDRVIEIHLSGGSWCPPEWAGGRRLRLDSHDAAVPDEVWALFSEVGPRCPLLRGVTVERIESPMPEDEIEAWIGEIERARVSCAGWGLAIPDPPPVPQVVPTLVPLPPLDPAERGIEREVAPLLRAPLPSQGVAHRLAAKLRFSRLMRGDPTLVAEFAAEPEALVQRFQAFHQEVPCAETPAEEAAAWRGFAPSR